MHSVANGTKRTSEPTRLMSAIGGKADIVIQGRDVRFCPHSVRLGGNSAALTVGLAPLLRSRAH